MVESAYTGASKASAREGLRVRVPLPARLSVPGALRCSLAGWGRFVCQPRGPSPLEPHVPSRHLPAANADPRNPAPGPSPSGRERRTPGTPRPGGLPVVAPSPGTRARRLRPWTPSPGTPRPGPSAVGRWVAKGGRLALRRAGGRGPAPDLGHRRSRLGGCRGLRPCRGCRGQRPMPGSREAEPPENPVRGAPDQPRTEPRTGVAGAAPPETPHADPPENPAQNEREPVPAWRLGPRSSAELGGGPRFVTAAWQDGERDAHDAGGVSGVRAAGCRLGRRLLGADRVAAGGGTGEAGRRGGTAALLGAGAGGAVLGLPG